MKASRSPHGEKTRIVRPTAADRRARARPGCFSGRAKGTGFLTLQNFWALKTYNISQLDAVRRPARRPAARRRAARRCLAGQKVALGRADLEALQRKLAALGHASTRWTAGFGPSTRAALRAWRRQRHPGRWLSDTRNAHSASA